MRTLYFTQITDDRFDKNIKQLLEKRIEKLKGVIKYRRRGNYSI